MSSHTDGAGSRPLTLHLLFLLLAFQGLSGLFGGLALTVDPSGSGIGLDVAWLEGSLFGDFRIPGILLLVVLGIGPLVVSVGVLMGTAWSWFASVTTGIALLVWIGVEISMVGYMARPPLQLIYALTGIAILGLTATPSIRHLLLGGTLK